MNSCHFAQIVGDTGAQEIDLAPCDEPDRYYAQLYHQVASGAEMEAKKVLEIGSGRGGGCSYVMRYLKPETMTGLDFFHTAIAFCTKTHRISGLDFIQGDAEHLPFESVIFDVVVNVESSHCYASFETYVREVSRVLKPGGRFLFADFRPIRALGELRRTFSDVGFLVEVEENITQNVLEAMDLTCGEKSQLVSAHVPHPIRRAFADFAGVPGTRVYNSFKCGEVQYMRYVLAKPEARE